MTAPYDLDGYTSRPYVTTVLSYLPTPALHAACIDAVSSILTGDRERARVALVGLDDDQRSRVMEVGAVLVAIAGGLDS